MLNDLHLFINTKNKTFLWDVRVHQCNVQIAKKTVETVKNKLNILLPIKYKTVE